MLAADGDFVILNFFYNFHISRYSEDVTCSPNKFQVCTAFTLNHGLHAVSSNDWLTEIKFINLSQLEKRNSHITSEEHNNTENNRNYRIRY